ncbi:hypothetical protein AAFF_G00351290 [Aldrovandia affinis]|uniref:Uncharacterized protein n=1 Tax=Aldrovandia affinis TaxID=143900 RepID=A0AAD7SJQ0_9TELE|nr:hypothetical protein AAFF_G00351290 [Aldrovandia affinis]
MSWRQRLCPGMCCGAWRRTVLCRSALPSLPFFRSRSASVPPGPPAFERNGNSVHPGGRTARGVGSERHCSEQEHGTEQLLAKARICAARSGRSNIPPRQEEHNPSQCTACLRSAPDNHFSFQHENLPVCLTYKTDLGLFTESGMLTNGTG